MSYRVVEWVMDNAPRHGGSKRAVLIALAWHARDDGTEARPSHETIAKRAGIGERTVRDALIALEAEGSISRSGYSAQGGTVIWRVVMAGSPGDRKALAAIRQDSPDRNSGGPAKPAARSGRSRRAVRQISPDQSGEICRQDVHETSRETSETSRPEPNPKDAPSGGKGRTDAAREIGQITIEGMT